MEMNRRELVVVAATLAACACASELLPESALAAPPPGGGPSAGGAGGAKAGGGVDIGTAKDYPKDGAYDKFAKNDKIMVMRSGEKLYATTAVCTHKACVLSGANTELRCRCHGSRFGLDGNPTKGPAKSALARFGIEKKGDHFVVDKSKKFEQDKWEDEGASVKLG
jgi:Rieske Fe-S protein